MLGAIASLFTGGPRKAVVPETVGAELAAIAADAGVGTPAELVNGVESTSPSQPARHRLTSAGEAVTRTERPRLAGLITAGDGGRATDPAITVSVAGDLVFRRDFTLTGGTSLRGTVRDAHRPLPANLVVTDQSGSPAW